MKILITGGHLTPALAIIDYLQQNSPYEIIFVGRLWSQKKNKQKAHEQEEIIKKKLKFIPFESGDITNVLDCLSLFFKIKQAKQILQIEKIDLLISFGSFLALPFALASLKLKIPVITHEQTTKMGLTNKIIALIANKVLLTFPEKLTYSKKTILIGNFLREELKNPSLKPDWFKNENNLPLLYITGGSQGAWFINNLIKNNLKQLLNNFIVIHQCGNPTSKHHYQRELELAKSNLPPILQKRYFIKPWITQKELAYIYQNTKLMVARAGANTVLEILSFKIPTLFIPYPYARFKEQFYNAKQLADKNQSLILEQTEINNEIFWQNLDLLNTNYHLFKKCLIQTKVTNQLENFLKIIQAYEK